MRLPGEYRAASGALATALAAVAALCWVLSVDRMQGMAMGPGTDPGSFTWFMATWVLMMAAMMLPSALPALQRFQHAGRGSVPIARGVVFAAVYLAIWTAFGAGAFLVYRGLLSAHPGLLSWERGGRYLVAATAIVAGLYQLTPTKRGCLRRCRTAGAGDDRPALVAALRYGADCVGCSIMLMVLLLVIGVMSTTWMIVTAAIVLVEKVASSGLGAVRVGAVGLIALGAWIAIDPASAPGLTIPM